MHQAVHTIVVATGGKGLFDITEEITDWLEQQKIMTGLLTIFCRHTSASLIIQENADADQCGGDVVEADLVGVERP